MEQYLPQTMQAYTWSHGHPTYIKSVSDEIASNHGWVQMRFHCESFDKLLQRIAVDNHIICDCSLFVQLVVLAINAANDDNNEKDSRKTYVLGTGQYAMRNLQKYIHLVTVLSLPKSIYDSIKHVNPDSAQYLIRFNDNDTNNSTTRYLGLAQSPMLMTLVEWQQHLAISFINNALQEPDDSLRSFQLNLEVTNQLSWHPVSIQC
jgi:hypothetical protein